MRASTVFSRLRADVTAAALIASALMAAACGAPAERSASEATSASPSASAPSERPRASGPKRLIIGLNQEPQKLNSALNAMVYGTFINNAIYGYFVKYDEKMNLIPDVLTEIPTLENGGISADSLTYTYHLRQGLKWHDGAPFTVKDVVFSINAIMNTNHEIESRTGYDKIKLDQIETPDDHTVILHLTEPYAPFLDEIFFSSGVMPEHLLASAVGPDFGAAPFHRAPVGLGPYKFKEWVPGSHVTIVRNDDYWRGKPDIEEITFRFIADSNSLLTSLQAHEIDGYDNAATSQYATLKTMPGLQVPITPQLMWEHVDMNVEDPILSDVRVRQAIQLAIDRDQISKEIYLGLWPPAHGDIDPKLKWFNPAVDQIVRHDPEAARRLLDEAGWKAGPDGLRKKGGKPLALAISTTAGRAERELAEQVIQHHLLDVGIDLSIQNSNATAFFAPYEQNGVLKRGKYQLAMYAWITSPDPNKKGLYHSSQVPPPEGQNHPRFRNAHLDQLIDEGLKTLAFEKRKPIYDEIQTLLATEVPMTPLIWRADIDPMTDRLKNFKPNPTQNGDTWNIWEWKLE